MFQSPILHGPRVPFTCLRSGVCALELITFSNLGSLPLLVNKPEPLHSFPRYYFVTSPRPGYHYTLRKACRNILLIH